MVGAAIISVLIWAFAWGLLAGLVSIGAVAGWCWLGWAVVGFQPAAWQLALVGLYTFGMMWALIGIACRAYWESK